MQDPDEGPGYLAMADTKPSLLLEGNPPLLIDEWQMAPVIWDAVRFAVDKRGMMSQFILTGSATPMNYEIAHSGTGRIARMLIRPMSLFESNGKVSLRDLFNGETDIGAKSTLTIEQIANALCRGGWPAAVVSGKESTRTAMNYVDAIINMDIQRVDGIEKDPERARVLLQSLARNVSTLATAALRTNAQGILRDFETFGFLFESLCTRDLRVYVQANDGGVFHYRDKSELECDLIIKLHDGRWAPVEVKLGNMQIEEAAANLIKLSNKIDAEKMNQPSFLMVLTGGQVAYKRSDGVLVVPIGCLKD